jgi:L-aminopeptidase/D-esterase-like protein
MMAILLVILIPLAALVIYAVVFDLKRRRRRDGPRSHDISAAARTARTNADAHGVSGLGQGTNVGGVGGGGGPGI